MHKCNFTFMQVHHVQANKHMHKNAHRHYTHVFGQIWTFGVDVITENTEKSFQNWSRDYKSSLWCCEKHAQPFWSYLIWVCSTHNESIHNAKQLTTVTTNTTPGGTVQCNYVNIKSLPLMKVISQAHPETKWFRCTSFCLSYMRCN